MRKNILRLSQVLALAVIVWGLYWLVVTENGLMPAPLQQQPQKIRQHTNVIGGKHKIMMEMAKRCRAMQ